MRLFRWLDELPSPFLVSLGLLFSVGVSVISYGTGWAYALTPLYLLPITMVSYHVGRLAGLTVAAVSTIGWAVAEFYSNIPNAAANLLYWNALVRFLTFVVICFILGHLKQINQRLISLATTDALTDLLNQRAFSELAALEIKRCRRYKRPFTLVFLDLDDFKAINDTFGHGVGNELLQTVAVTLRTVSRATDYLARFGGDEFEILLTETASDAADQYLRRMTLRLRDATQAKGWNITSSIGAITFDTAPASVDEMIQQADGLMYAVKKSGKNSIEHKVYNEIDDHP